MSKNKKILLFCHDYFSIFQEIKTRTYIKNLRQSFLHMNSLIKHVKCYVWEMNIKRIKVKNKFSSSSPPCFEIIGNRNKTPDSTAPNTMICCTVYTKRVRKNNTSTYTNLSLKHCIVKCALYQHYAVFEY